MIQRERMFLKISGCGVSYAVVDQFDFRNIYLVADSGGERNPKKAIDFLLHSVETALKRENGLDSVLESTFFCRNYGHKELLRLALKEFFGDAHLPITTFVPQADCSGALFSLELNAVAGDGLVGDTIASRSRYSPILRLDQNSVRCQYNGFTILHCAGIVPENQPIGSYSRSRSAFENLNLVLKKHGFPLSQLFRTWIYQGNIVAPEGQTQRYKELNRARTDFFAGTRFLTPFLTKMDRGTPFPSSTGIGTNDFDVVISAMAVASGRSDLVVTPLENPEQTSSFDYDEVYSPQSPKFARAMLLAAGNDARIFVSGTASITNSESRHFGDPLKQTEQTLDNIERLISGDNLNRHGVSGFETSLEDFAVARVYIKNQEDYAVIRNCCEKRLGATPILYTIADVCRPELLVEIEGIAISKKNVTKNDTKD